MGIRASDAFYPSICIQSMLGAGNDDTDYDVIILEYSNTNPDQHLVNDDEIKGLRMLVRRLQYRYPNSILVYVHLYSLRHVIKDSHGNFADDHDEPPPSIQWSWAYTHKQIYRPPKSVRDLMKSVGGYIYKFPVPETTSQVFELFSAPTYHSLSARGHRIVGDAIADILQKKAKFNKVKIEQVPGSIEGSWGWGDQCLSWLGMGGVIPVEYGGEGVEKRDMGNFQWSLEFVPVSAQSKNDQNENQDSGGWIKVVNDKEIATPLYFTFLVGGTLDSSTIIYANDVTTELKSNVSKGFQTQDVGWVGPGTTLVRIQPQTGSILQLVGISLFGFYQHKDLPFKSMHNTIVDEEVDEEPDQ